MNNITLRHEGASGPTDLLSLANVTKSFGQHKVLDDVSLTVRSGEAVALLGHNGSGKSTLIKILAGFHQPDAGVAASPSGSLELGSYQAAHRAGLRFVHQDLGLVGSMNVVDNFALGGAYPRKAYKTIDWAAARDAARRSLEALGVSIDVNAAINGLSPAQRTTVAIARALRDFPEHAKVLVLDEPTATMSHTDAERLYPVLERLRESDLGVIFVTHHLNEVPRVADRAVVLRNGVVAGEARGDDLEHNNLVRLLLGRDVDVWKSAIGPSDTSGDAETVLKVQEIAAGSLLPTSFVARRGEVLGFAGLIGSGREHLLPALTGCIPRSGEVAVGTEQVRPANPGAAVKAGIALVSADRARRALFPTFSSGRNLTVGTASRYRRFGLVNRASESADVKDWFAKLGVIPVDDKIPIGALSGGNQQKVSIGRALRHNAHVLAVEEPTQGVDVGARAHIHRLLQEASTERAVLVSSSDADELAAICTRVLVFERGRVTHELTGDELDASRIDQALLGPHHSQESAK